MNEVERLRLFVAATVPEGHLTWLGHQVEPLKQRLAGARWAPLENQHITLKFLGSTPSDRLDAVKSAVGTVAASHEPAEIAIGSLGAFPTPRRARVLWAGLDDAAGVLSALASDLDSAFEPLGYKTEKRAFTPHLTVARFKTPIRLTDLPELDTAELSPWTVDSIELFRSRLHPQGARYEMLERIPLEGIDVA